MKRLFVILTRNSDYVSKCVESIRSIYQDDIVIVDSDSSDLSYIDAIKNSVTSVDLIKNKNYMDGAIWYVYKNYPDYTHYSFFQDSTELINNIDFAFNAEICSVQYFNDVYDHWRDSTMSQKLKQFTNLDMPLSMVGLFGPMMICTRRLLDRAYELGMSNVLPEDKVSQNSMERVWGVVISHLGYDIISNSIEGIHRGQGFKDYKYVIKRYVERT